MGRSMMMHYCQHCKDQGKEKLFKMPKDGKPSIWLLKHVIKEHPESSYAKVVMEKIPAELLAVL